MALCATFISYVLSGLIVNPPWPEVMAASITPTFARDAEFLLMAIGVIGTTITPWGQFYVQASIVDKGITAKDYIYTRWDVLIGSFFTGFVAFFIIVATAATLYANHVSIETVKDAALALEPLAGKYASTLFAFGFAGGIDAGGLHPAAEYGVCHL